MGDQKVPDTQKESKSGFQNISAIHVVIIIGIVIVAVVFIAKFGFSTDLMTSSSGEMAIAKRPVVTPSQTLSKDLVRPERTLIKTLPPTVETTVADCSDIQSDPNNCGACGNVCSVTSARKNVAEYGCTGGKCTVKTCQAGYGDCWDTGTTDVNTNGCETDLKTGVSWAGGQTPAYVFQANSPDQKVYLERPQNCGSCGNLCEGGNQQFGICDNGACRKVCWGPWLDCDSNGANGCEQVWNKDNCGACGAKCPDGTSCNDGCCWKPQYNAAINQMEQVAVADSTGATCSGHAWQRQ